MRLTGIALSFVIACSTAQSSAQDVADTIYTGGPIHTINDAQPSAEAVAVKDGTILFVGALSEAMAHHGDGTEVFDLDGRTMLPGFVDSHGHVVLGGMQALSANLLPPPDGPSRRARRSWARARAGGPVRRRCPNRRLR